MLEAAKLPPSLWGEAILTAAYLWNRTESTTLPPGQTPFELVNGCKPNLSYIRVFGSKCWARIPSELQTKLGPHARRAIFLGYPEGIKAYHVWDETSEVFFVARDVEFDENIPGLHSSSDTDSEEDEEETSPVSGTPNSPTPAANTPITNVLHRSIRVRKLTEKGAAWEAKMAATKSRLQYLQKRHTEASQPQDETKGVPSNDKGVSLEEIDSLAPIEENAEVPDNVANTVNTLTSPSEATNDAIPLAWTTT